MEVEILVDQLFTTKTPLSDIDGRPTFIEITKGEIGRRFHKKSSREDELF